MESLGTNCELVRLEGLGTNCELVRLWKVWEPTVSLCDYGRLGTNYELVRLWKVWEPTVSLCDCGRLGTNCELVRLEGLATNRFGCQFFINVKKMMVNPIFIEKSLVAGPLFFFLMCCMSSYFKILYLTLHR